ncbi:YbjQ family protein [Halioxenophilus sp. WMMB6]|uniref:YbjQ family protein n=1 Tax=Halioxenophilus sp. WMMB6 TaxID=3073815 RepID=UPI00295ECFBA|nr:heavy metal-binding domain-containing protein [Halioxenophilus sp. WMMB6]
MEQLILFLVLLTLGYIFGRQAEKRHFKSIFEREAKYQDILCFSERLPPAGMGAEGVLVSGSVVVAVDYFKMVAASLRNLVGGRVTAFETLLERGRREAILRMKEEAERRGAKLIVNVKLETASITKGAKNQSTCVEVYAYGTAMVPAKV